MSFNKLRNTMLTMSGLQISNTGFVTTGIVTNIDSANRLIQVRVSESYDDQQPLATNWIPIASPWVGNGFGMFATPNYNDLVLLIFAEGDSQNPICTMGIFNDEDQPLNVPPGEFWLVHKTGTFIKLTNDGKLGLNGNVEIDLTSPQINITCTTECKIQAPSILINGSSGIKIGNTSNSLNKLINDTIIDLFNNHIHPTPSGNSSPPTTTMNSSNATNIVEAN